MQNIISRSSKPTSTFELNHLEFRGKDENVMKEIMKAKSVSRNPGFGHVIFPAFIFFFRFNYT